MLTSNIDADPSATNVPGIAWYQGDVDSAFKAAQSNHKPVLLYWGAKWCPPCQQLKSFVFTRTDFTEKSKQFVAVYLDGDNPGAQRWGEKFHVSGYPTVVILRPDRIEITRMSGGMDLSLYAELLEAALSDAKPLREVLAILRKNPAALSASDCRRLAYYSWDEGNFLVPDPKILAADLERAASKCQTLNPTERARLTVSSAVLSTTPERTRQVLAIVKDQAIAPHLVDVLEALQEPFFTDVRSQDKSAAAEFKADWIRTMDQAANDPAVVDADQLYAIGAKLVLVKQFAADKKVPLEVAAAARARVTTALAKHVDPYIHSGIVNGASFIDNALDDNDAMYQMLIAEVNTSKTPFYYMVDLGQLEEERGHGQEALAWYERAYRESTGTATRFEWGYDYLAALLRLAPTEHERIRRVGIEVIAELNGPDRIHARARGRLEKLDAALRKWDSEHRYDRDITALHAYMQNICAKLPTKDSGRGTCRKFLST
jgi:thiol-disulfide isomerase/thioredoxin